MKKQIRMMVIVACSILGLSAVVATTGCKGSGYHRTAGTYVDDSTITAKVKAQLIGDKTTKAHEINVDTYQGHVQLNGFVDTMEMKQRAEEIARGVSGVVAVQNNLQLKPEAAGSNSRPGADVRIQTNP